jgi:hypothetical protein
MLRLFGSDRNDYYIEEKQEINMYGTVVGSNYRLKYKIFIFGIPLYTYFTCKNRLSNEVNMIVSRRSKAALLDFYLWHNRNEVIKTKKVKLPKDV